MVSHSCCLDSLTLSSAGSRSKSDTDADAVTTAVILACRTVSKGEQLKQALVREAQACGTAQPHVEVQALDLASLASVRAFAAAWQGRHLHILINNAGLFGLGGEQACIMRSLVPGKAAGRSQASQALHPLLPVHLLQCHVKPTASPHKSSNASHMGGHASYLDAPGMLATRAAAMPHPSLTALPFSLQRPVRRLVTASSCTWAPTT